MLDFLNQASLTPSDFNKSTEFLMPGVLAKNMITLVYADGGNGKSWLGFAIANYCANANNHVVYLDYDNPLSVLQERGVDKKLVAAHQNLLYIQRSKSELSAYDLLHRMSQNATSQRYANHVIIIDSLRNFAEVNNDNKIMAVMDMLMDLREAGATIVVLHHSNKDGRNYQGSNHIRNSVDNMFQLKKLALSNGIGVLLEVKKERCSINDCAFEIDPATFTMHVKDIIEARLSEDDLHFVEAVKRTIELTPGLNKTALLEAAGTSKDDKTARARLEKYEGIYWQSKKHNNRIVYQVVA